jgi:hypothetical protein
VEAPVLENLDDVRVFAVAIFVIARASFSMYLLMPDECEDINFLAKDYN